MDRDTLVAALGVSSDPTTGEIRIARRGIARRLHPDRGTGQRTNALMAEVNAACDRWIAEIRAARTSPEPPARVTPTRQPPTSARPSRRRSPPATPTTTPRSAPTVRRTPRLRMGEIAATVALLVIVAALIPLLVGASVGAVAAGLLLGAGAALIYLIILRRLADRRAGP